MGAACCKKTKISYADTEPSAPDEFILTNTGIASADTLLIRAQEYLNAFGHLRKALLEAYTRLQKTTSSALLINPTLEDTVMAMLYAYSASSGGNLQKVNFALDDSAPFIRVNSFALRPEHRRIAEAWEKFVAALEEAGPGLSQLEGARFVGASVATLKRIREETRNLGLYARRRAVNAATANLKVLEQVPQLVETTVQLQAQLKTELYELVSGRLQDHETQLQIKNVGKNARATGIFDSQQLVTTYWPDSHQISLRAN